MIKRKILIEDYSNTWALTFLQLKEIYQLHLSDLIVDIQHVGSTSVIGLASKPIIDIDIIIDERGNLNSIIKKLELLGYDYQGNLGITDRESFRCQSDQSPTDGSLRTWQKHNLYVCPSDSLSLKNHLALRDFLCKNKDKAKEYGELKRKLASENPYDINSYTEGKTSFITAILKEVGFDNTSTESITRENKVTK